MTHTTDKWLAAQAAFISGESARAISIRLELSLPALRQRIVRGGWCRQRDLGKPNRTIVPKQVSRELFSLSKRLAVLGEVVSASA